MFQSRPLNKVRKKTFSSSSASSNPKHLILCSSKSCNSESTFQFSLWNFFLHSIPSSSWLAKNCISLSKTIFGQIFFSKNNNFLRLLKQVNLTFCTWKTLGDPSWLNQLIRLKITLFLFRPFLSIILIIFQIHQYLIMDQDNRCLCLNWMPCKLSINSLIQTCNNIQSLHVITEQATKLTTHWSINFSLYNIFSQCLLMMEIENLLFLFFPLLKLFHFSSTLFSSSW